MPILPGTTPDPARAVQRKQPGIRGFDIRLGQRHQRARQSPVLDQQPSPDLGPNWRTTVARRLGVLPRRRKKSHEAS